MRFSEGEARDIVEPYAPMLRDAMTTGWNAFQALPIAQRVALGPGSRATRVHDYTVWRVRELFDRVAQARCVVRSQLFMLCLGGVVLIRFKKLDDDWRSCGWPTQQNFRFLNQMGLPGVVEELEQLELFEVVEPAHWEAGYRVSDEGSLLGTYLTQPNGNGNPDWIIDLGGSDDGSFGARHLEPPSSAGRLEPVVVSPRDGNRKQSERSGG